MRCFLLLLFLGLTGAELFPDRTTTPLVAPEDLEVIAKLPVVPGNIDLDHKGRVFFTFHPAGGLKQGNLAELIDKSGKYKLFPSAAFQSQFNTALAIRIDRQSKRMYVLDYANEGKDPTNYFPSLFCFDLEKNIVLFRYYFPDQVAPIGSRLSDMVLSADYKFIYITDSSIDNPAIIVVDVSKKDSWRVLESHRTTKTALLDTHVNGKSVSLPWGAGVDSIAIDPMGRFILYAPMHGDKIYSVHTKLLKMHKHMAKAPKNDEGLHPMLAKGIEEWGVKSATESMYLDRQGNIFLTDFEHSAINMARKGDQALSTLVRDPKMLRWPDGLAVYEGYLYITCSAVNEVLEAKAAIEKAPFHILRIKLPSPKQKGEL